MRLTDIKFLTLLLCLLSFEGFGYTYYNSSTTVTSGFTDNGGGGLAANSTLTISNNSTVVFEDYFGFGENTTLIVESGSSFTLTSSSTPSTLTIIIRENASFTATSSLYFKGNLTLEGDLTVNGPFQVQAGATMTVEETGTYVGTGSLGIYSDIIVEGSFTSTGQVEMNSNGSMTVKNNGVVNLNTSGNSQIQGDFIVESGGDATITGDIILHNDGNFVVDGALDVTGNLNLNYGNTEITGSGTLTAPNITNNGEIFGNTSNPYDVDCSSGCNSTGSLPIELLSFTYNKVNNHLEWKTSSEINNDYFTIEYSADGYVFEKVAIIKGAGNSNIIESYDWAIPEGLITKGGYLRLKQTDFDGQFEYFTAISITPVDSRLTNQRIMVAPNPVSSANTNIRIVIPQGIMTESATIQLIQMDGKVILEKHPESSLNVIEVPKDINGLFFVKYINANGFVTIEKVLCQ